MSCNLTRDENGKIRRAMHDRTLRKQNNEKPLEGDKVSLRWCDGERHWIAYGWGPGVERSRWLTEAIQEKCPDQLQREHELFIEQQVGSGSKQSFDNFIVAVENRDAVAKIKNWIKANHMTLVLYGATGRGKTHLARAVQFEFLTDNRETAFITAEALYEVFLKAQPSANEFDLEAQQQLADVRRADLLVIDDLGAERQATSGFFQEQLKKLLDEKHGRMIITTNLPLRDLEARYNEKIISRLMEGSVMVPLRGKDYRRSA